MNNWGQASAHDNLLLWESIKISSNDNAIVGCVINVINAYLNKLQEFVCLVSGFRRVVKGAKNYVTISKVDSVPAKGTRYILLKAEHPAFSLLDIQRSVCVQNTYPYWQLRFPVLNLKYLSLKNYSANFVQNCKVYSKLVLVNEIILISSVV